MRLVTFDAGDGPRLGTRLDDRVIDLLAATGPSGAGDLPPDMLSFIQAGEPALQLARKVENWARENLDNLSSGIVYDIDAVRLLAPLSHPRKLMCLGLNYKEHAAETGAQLPTEPLIFSKFTSAIIGQGDSIVIPRQSEEIDFEAELAFVVGRGGRHIPKSEALEHVFGYTIMNDVSCREYQSKWSQWQVGKSFDTFAPLGPDIVTADGVPDPHNLRIQFKLNDEVMQDSNTGDMIFKIPFIIAYASSLFTLAPGDLISTGTPPGVGAGRKPPRWLRPGDTARTEIESLGVLVNPVEAE